MAGVGPLELAAAMHEVAAVLDGAPVRVIGLDARGTYSFESVSAVITVTVHLGSAADVDQVAGLLDLGPGEVSHRDDLYSRGGHRSTGVYIGLYGSARRPVSVVGVAS